LWRLVAAAALAGLAAGCASTTPTASGKGRPPVVEMLPNGLTLIVQQHRAADIVAVYLWVGTGVRYETPETLGHAHFQEHMLFKGTDKFGPGYIDRTVEGTGGRSNAFTTFDYTTYQVQVPGEATAVAIQLLEDMAFRSTFDPKEVDAERQVISEESRIETDNPRTGIVRQLYGMVFGPHPYGRPVLGTPATMGAATQDNLKVFNHRFYTPENMALVVVGPVDAKAVRPWSTAPSAGARAPGTRRPRIPRWRPSPRGCGARSSGRSSRRSSRSAGRPRAPRIATAWPWTSSPRSWVAARARAWSSRSGTASGSCRGSA
jgi:zinc protease